MAQRRNSPANKGRQTRTVNSRTGKAGAGNSRGAAKSNPRGQAKNKQNNAGTDMVGVILVAIGIALMVAVIYKETGLLTDGITKGLMYLVGVGAYILPVLIVLVGASYFIPSKRIREWRIAAGLGTILTGVVSLVSLATPEKQFFESVFVSQYGGYLGALFAWVFTSITGMIIAAIVFVTLIILGILFTGLSLSDAFRSIFGKVKEARLARDAAGKSKTASKTMRVEGKQRNARKRPDFDDDMPTKVIEPPHLVDPIVNDTTKTRMIPMPGAQTTVLPKSGNAKTSRASAASGDYLLPSAGLLNMSPPQSSKISNAEQGAFRSTAEDIVQTLGVFNVVSRCIGWVPGPTVTLFKLEIAQGIKLTKITSLADDLALALAAPTIRILAPIPGEKLVGIEVPNSKRSSVTLGDILSPPSAGGPLLLSIGKDVGGNPITADLAKMPHLLIGGTTGSGKSVALNTMLISMLMRATPEEVRLILIDPKRVEMSMYNDIAHLYVPVVTEVKDAAAALAWACTEMDRRLRMLQRAQVKDIASYQALLRSAKRPEWAEDIPFIVIVIDELADLMLVAAKEVEASIVRLAALARATGIHLIVATQRPEANVVTGLIRANIVNRIAFSVATSIDSRVILDQTGAEKLTGLGDMLFSTPAWPKAKRIQGCFVSEDEILAVTCALKDQGKPNYHKEIFSTSPSAATSFSGSDVADDPHLKEAASLIVSSGVGSTSFLQRRLKVGYARAGRLMDMLEERGIVGPPDGSKPREVLVSEEDLARVLSSLSSSNGEDSFDEMIVASHE